MEIQATPLLSFACSQAIAPYLRVKYDATYGLELAGPEDLELGTTAERHIVSGVGAASYAVVVSRHAPGTIKMVASGAITVQAQVYGSDDGKVSATANGNCIGINVGAATTTDGDYLEVYRMEGLGAGEAGNVGGLDFFDDFLGDWPAAATAVNRVWTKTETNGLGVTASDQANGVLKLVLDNTEEAATAAIEMAAAPFTITSNPVFEARVAIYDISAANTADFNFGLTNASHATDMDAATRYALFHLDGAALDVKVQTTDGATTVAATDTTVNAVDDTFAVFKIDASDLTDVKFYINATRVLSTTTFDISAWTGTCTPVFHVEKASGTNVADMRVDWVRVQCGRA
jgi:hypothetical protein